MSDYSVTLSTTEPNNYVGLIKLRQGDVASQSIQATITANGQLFNFDHLAVFFNAVLPNGYVVRDKVTNVDYANSKLNYVVADSFLQEVAQVTAWFSFENDEKIIDSTKNFQYSVIPGWKECIPQGNYIYELSEIQREIEEIISNKDFTTLLSELDFLKTNIAYLDNNIKTIKADVNNSFNDKLSQISFVPETFANLSAIQATYPNGKTGLFVTADTGHKFIWANGSWSDAGFYQAVGNNLVSGEITYATPFVAPYNDLDTLPLNKIVTYGTSDIKSVANIPKSLNSDIYGATVYTLSNDSNLAGSVQYFVGRDNATYSRIAWGNPAVYSDWQPLGKTNLSFRNSSNTVAPYDDLNTIPENVSVTYVDNIQQIKNIPNDSAVKSATVMKFGGVDGVGSIEVMTSVDDEKLFYRMTWGNSNNWLPWHSVADGEAYLPGKMVFANTGAPYDDMNTFPMNQTITIAETPETITQIKNLPPLNGAGGLTVRSFNWDASNTGGVQIAIDNNNIMYHRIAWALGGKNQWGAWRTDRKDDTNNQKDDTNSNDILPSLALFQKIAVVGDSYASGELAFDYNYTDHYPISWLQIMARKNGFVGTNFSVGGISTRSFLTNKTCLPALQNAEQQDLYILALGINDKSIGADYLGTPADMDSEADTFYGNYGKIIKAIKAKAPQAKMVISTITQDDSIANAYNDAIKQIASHFSIPLIVQNDDPLFQSSFYKDHMQGGHPTGPVYAAMARAFERLIGQSMIDHLDYWMDYYKNEPNN